jgi:Uma2 family endonuclease
MSIISRHITTEEFLAMPEDGVERDLIEGEVRVRGQIDEDLMTIRNRSHSRAMGKISYALIDWNERQTEPGEVLVGEIGCILRRNPDTTVGIDVAYFPHVTLQSQSGNTTLVEGAPLLAVEITSPSDNDEEIFDKMELYLNWGTQIVWIARPRIRAIEVHRPNQAPEFFNEHQIITAEPHLPGFAWSVAKLF